MNYAQYLKSLGATDEDIKILDTPIARKAWEQQQAAVATAEQARADAIARATAIEKANQDWYNNDILPKYTQTEADMVAAKAEADRAKTVIREMAKRDAALAQVAKDMGYNVESNTPPPNAPPNTPAGFDPSKFVTTDLLVQTAEREGDAIAIAQDIAYEHSRLFPDQPLNFRELRKEAVASRKSVEQLWLEKFHVPEARQKQADARRAADEARIREDERKKVEAEWAGKYGDPNLRPLVPSSSPFTTRAADTTRAGKQPWEVGSNALSRDRVQKATTAVMQQAGKA